MKRITLSLAVCSALFLGGCVPSTTTLNQNAGKIGGTAVGAGLGAAIGKQLGGRDGAIIGAALGGFLGYLVGSDIDKRRAELAKIAEQEKIEIYTTDITSNDMTSDVVTDTTDSISNTDTKAQSSTKQAVVGDIFTIISGDNQFDVGSSKLNANAVVAYNKFAQQYATSNRKILIIGHTDDSGDSAFNQKLSEERAKYVSEVFASNGIKQENIYYLGAGETQPVADNNTQEGASKNRRVEIIELNNEADIVQYASTRTTNPKFFREVTPKYIVKATPKKENKLVEQSANIAKSEKSVIDGKVSPIKEDKKVSYKHDPKTFIDFKGDLVKNNDFTLASYFGEPIHNNSSKSFFTTKAMANDNMTGSYLSCINDKPRIAGNTKSLATGDSVNYSTKDYKKGLNETSWVSNIDEHLLGITPVGVLKDGSKITQTPDVLVYKDYAIKNGTKADVKLKTHVNTYQGTQGMIYRVFVDDESSQLKCVDVVFDEKNTNHSIGKLYYVKNDGIYQREFQIKQLVKNN